TLDCMPLRWSLGFIPARQLQTCRSQGSLGAFGNVWEYLRLFGIFSVFRDKKAHGGRGRRRGEDGRWRMADGRSKVTPSGTLGEAAPGRRRYRIKPDQTFNCRPGRTMVSGGLPIGGRVSNQIGNSEGNEGTADQPDAKG